MPTPKSGVAVVSQVAADVRRIGFPRKPRRNESKDSREAFPIDGRALIYRLD